MDSGEKNSSVMESFQTIKDTHLGQTPLQNVVGRVSVAASETVGGEGGVLGSSGYNTKCLYEALCVLRRSEDRKTLCFYRLPGMCGGPPTSALLAFVILPPAINPLVV